MGAASILIESAALYSLSGILYLVPFSLQYGTGILFGQIWSKMSVSPRIHSNNAIK